MKRLTRKRFKKIYIALIIVLLIIFYTECLTYYFNKYNWNKIHCQDEELCTKVILLADPQIIGQQNEVLHLLTPLTIWDSDRYLRVTYQQVVNYVQPNVVIFLGDLFDEGSISSELDFKSYIIRLHSIFQTKQNSAVQYIWLPGDNDIGGEGMDIITAKKVDKFNRAFPQPDKVQYKNITFYKINKLLHYIPDISDKLFSGTDIKIGLSHVPILSSHSTFADEVLEKLQPHVLFTAHEHKSKIIHLNIKNRDDRQVITTNPKLSKSYQFTFGTDSVYEFVVPTCSYRMGTMDMGYGYAIIEGSHLQYTVLWSPARFPTLILYCLLMVLILIILLINICWKLICCKTNM